MKPSKPTPDFPLFPHASGKWAKKINGKLRYFGRWENPAAALEEYQRWCETHSTAPDRNRHRPKLVEAANQYMASKRRLLEAGELVKCTYGAHHRTCRQILGKFGRQTAIADITPIMFGDLRKAISSGKKLRTVGNEISGVRAFFKWCYESGLVDRPVRFGPDFRRPALRSIRKENRGREKKLLTQCQIQSVLDESGVHMRAMVLLGINCGYGPADCATLPLRAVERALDSAWLEYPRPKTEIERECPLWPETVAALRESLARRPSPRQDAQDLFFVRPNGREWRAGVISKLFSALVLRAFIRAGGFYWLRHTLETVGGDCKDQVALDRIMGHSDRSMAANYRERIAPERLRAVTDYVRAWFLSR